MSFASVYDRAGEVFDPDDDREISSIALLRQKHARLYVALLEQVFPFSKPVPSDRCHDLFRSALEELGSPVDETPAEVAKDLVRRGWLVHEFDASGDTRVYRPTSAAELVRGYVRASTDKSSLSRGVVESILDAAARLADATIADPQALKDRIDERIHSLEEKKGALTSATPLSEDALVGEFNHLKELARDLPGYFAQIVEAIRTAEEMMRRKVMESQESLGEAFNEHVLGHREIMASATGQAYLGALELLNDAARLDGFEDDIRTILTHEFSSALSSEERRAVGRISTTLMEGNQEVEQQILAANQRIRALAERYAVGTDRRLTTVLRDLEGKLSKWAPANPSRPLGIEPHLDRKPARTHVFLDTWTPVIDPVVEDVLHGDEIIFSMEEALIWGGPSLEVYAKALEADPGDRVYAHEVFNSMPEDLRRPVEVFGLFQLAARSGQRTSEVATYHAVHPTGETQDLYAPVMVFTSSPDATAGAES